MHTALCKYAKLNKDARVHGERCRCSDGCNLGIVHYVTSLRRDNVSYRVGGETR